jgi:hypothetical protein
MKRAVVTLRIEDVEKFLDLPEGVSIAGLRDNWQMLGIDVLLEGSNLPVEEHVPGTEPPHLHLIRHAAVRLALEMKTQ